MLDRDPAAAGAELALLPTFEVFARVRSFAVAGSILNLTRAAVHHRISTLEDVLGGPLYRRVRRVLSLTPLGCELQRYARDVLLRRREWLRAAMAPGRARLACDPNLLAAVLLPVVARFERERHGELEIQCADASAAIDAIVEDRADIAIVRSDERPPGLPGRVLVRASMVVAARPGHPLHAAGRICSADLAEVRVFATRKFAAVPHAIVQPSTEAAIACAEAGLGVALVESYQRIPRSMRARLLAVLSHGAEHYRLLLDAPRATLRIVHSRLLRVLHAPFELRRLIFEHFLERAGDRNKPDGVPVGAKTFSGPGS